MKYEQRDIVEINFVLPEGVSKVHPALIISDKMLTVPMQKQSYVKCQILVSDVDRDVIRKISRMKQPYFNEVIEKIKETIF